MPQYPRPYRPIRNLQSLDRLERLANQFVDLSLRNDLEAQRRQQEVERRARAMQMKTGLFGELSAEPNIAKRNIARERAMLGLQELGVNYSPHYETEPKVTERAPKNLVPRPTGNTKTEKGLQFEEFVDVDPTQPFDQSKLSIETPRYWKPAGNVPKDTKSDQEGKDLENYRAKYNEANAYVKQLEDIYGRDKLMQWNQDPVVQKNITTYGDDAVSILEAINSGKLTPEEKLKMDVVKNYTKYVSDKKAQDLNLAGKGYYVGDDGKLYKGTKPAPRTGNSLTKEDEQAIAWAKANPNDPRAKQILELNKVK